MLYDLMCDEDSGFDVVNRTIPDIGGQLNAPALLEQGGRLVKTHERYFPRYRKAVYLVRDVRDVVSSEHRHQQVEGMFHGDLETFLIRFLRGRANAFARWDHHVTSWLDSPLHGSGQLLVLRFEEMRKHPAESLMQVLRFLGLPMDVEKIQGAVERNDLRRMQDKEDTTPQGPGTSARDGIRFVSQGQVKGWRKHLSSQQVESLNKCFGPTLKRLDYEVTD
jgi:hypothetical protein